MSINSIVKLAAARDAQRSVAPGVPPDPVAVAAAADVAGPPQGTLDTLSAAIPADVIALYTTVLGVIAGVVKGSSNSTYLPLRWWLYIGSLLAVLIAIYVGYRVTNPPNKRDFPAIETATAIFSFAVWGLVIPESPIYVSLSSPLLPVVVGVMSGVGVFVLTAIFKPLLNKS